MFFGKYFKLTRKNKVDIINSGGVYMKKLINILIFTIFLCSFSFAETSANQMMYNENDVNFNIRYATKLIHNLLGLEMSAETLANLEDIPEYDGAVYLTFDDGPVKGVTDKILDILKEYDVEATFFCLGSYIEKSPELTKRAYDEGHAIASHSYSHKSSMFNSVDNFTKEVVDTNEAIKAVIDKYPDYFRVPYGTKLNAGLKNVLLENNLESVGWNCETYDSRAGKKNAEDLLKAVKDTMPKKGKDVVVIMHDTYGKQHTVDALPSIIEYFQSINYEFKSFKKE